MAEQSVYIVAAIAIGLVLAWLLRDPKPDRNKIFQSGRWTDRFAPEKPIVTQPAKAQSLSEHKATVDLKSIREDLHHGRLIQAGQKYLELIRRRAVELSEKVQQEMVNAQIQSQGASLQQQLTALIDKNRVDEAVEKVHQLTGVTRAQATKIVDNLQEQQSTKR